LIPTPHFPNPARRATNNLEIKKRNLYVTLIFFPFLQSETRHTHFDNTISQLTLNYFFFSTSKMSDPVKDDDGIIERHVPPQDQQEKTRVVSSSGKEEIVDDGPSAFVSRSRQSLSDFFTIVCST
jgi:hypothetical protein